LSNHHIATFLIHTWTVECRGNGLQILHENGFLFITEAGNSSRSYFHLLDMLIFIA